MAREGYLILDSDLHLMEPEDLWSRFMDKSYQTNLPRFFDERQRQPGESAADKANADIIFGMQVQGLTIPAFGKSAGEINSARELRRRSRARHPHFQVARARGFDPDSTLHRNGH